MHAFALPYPLACFFGVARASLRRRKSASVRPKAPPARSMSRRVRPSHSRFGEPRTRSMNPPQGWEHYRRARIVYTRGFVTQVDSPWSLPSEDFPRLLHGIGQAVNVQRSDHDATGPADNEQEPAISEDAHPPGRACEVQQRDHREWQLHRQNDLAKDQ